MLKIIFLTLIVILFSCSKKPNNSLLKIAIPLSISKIHFDPTNILTSTDSNIIRSIYSTLFEFSANGELRNGLADNISFKNNEAYITLKKMKLSDGSILSPSDVIYSIKRAIILDNKSHLDLSLILTCNHSNGKIDDYCPGIFEKDNQVVFKIKDKRMFPILINSLALMDFAIIPKKALNSKLEIINQTITTGPYSVVEINKKLENISLVRNDFHFHNSNRVAKNVIYMFIPNSKINNSFNQGIIDIIPTYYSIRESQIEKLTIEKNIFRTTGIKSYFFHYTSRGVKNFNKQERLYYGNQLKKLYLLKNPPPPSVTLENQFFPKLSEAALENSTITNLESKLDKILIQNHPRLTKKIKIGTDDNFFDLFKSMFGKLENFEVIKTNGVPWSPENRNQVDICISNTDTTFHDTFSVITYNLLSEFFGNTQSEANKLIRDYLNLETESEKISFIKKIHYNVLEEGKIIPLGHAPYIAISNKKWKLNLSSFYAGTPIWSIEENNY